MHIRHVTLWELKQGNSAKVAFEKTGNGEELMSDRAVSNWFVKFRSRDATLKHQPTPGRLSHFEDNLLKAILQYNPRQSTRGDQMLS